MPILAYTISKHSLAHLLATHATSDPDALAVLASGRPSLKGKQLPARTCEVGSLLNSWEIGHNNRVAIKIF
jgi:hypothetical protein